ncbi:SsrA-binding protein SmpB [Candidatus Babeliales bacterium]|nr:SsrA-binding protein SmpB [Candidatus Babeliales bacterium]
MKIIVQNKKALFDYEISYKMEAGIVLTGDEVKSIRANHVSLNGSFATVKDGELFLLNCNISTYSHAYQKDDDQATRTRKLLLHRKEVNRLIGEVSQKGMTVLPLKIYLNEKGLIKVELGVGKHRKAHNKKELLKERDIARETRRELKNSRS